MNIQAFTCDQSGKTITAFGVTGDTRIVTSPRLLDDSERQAVILYAFDLMPARLWHVAVTHAIERVLKESEKSKK